MRGTQRLVIDNFAAGLVTSADPTGLPEGAARDLLNVEPMGTNGIKRRRPTELLATPGEPMFRFFYSEHLPYASIPGASIIGVGNTKLFRLDNYTDLGAHGLTGNRIVLAEAAASGGQGPIYMQDLVSARYFTATAFGAWTASAGTLPISQNGSMVYHGNRMWIGSTAANPSRLFFSEIGNPRAWPAANYVDIEPSAGGPITGLCRCGPYLLVFKRRRTYVVYDLNTGANRLLANVGSVNEAYGASGESVGGISQTPGRYGTAYFASPAGIYQTDGSSVRKIDDNLVLRDQPVPLAYIDGFLAVQAREAPGIVLLYDEERGSWWQHQITTTTLSSYIGAGATDPRVATPRLVPGFLISDTTRAVFWRPNHTPQASDATADADGTTFDSYWAGGHLDMGNPSVRKRVRTVDIQGSGLGFLKLAKNGASTASSVALTFGDMTVGTVGRARVNSPGVARFWSPMLSGFGSNAAWRVHSMTMALQARSN